MTLKAINWNDITDPIDKQIWDRLTSNFWLPEAIPVSNDLPSWEKMTKDEQRVVDLVFANLTLLDTVQSNIGAPTLQDHAQTMHEEAVFANIGFMEAVHAKSYSTIFSTFRNTNEIDRLFRWVHEDEDTQRQAKAITDLYRTNKPGVVHVASVALESFLFYTGFYAPLRFAAEGRITNTADIIRLIMRDEGVHGYYIGYKFQKLREQGKADITDEEIYEFIHQLYAIEVLRTQNIYDPVGWTEDVKNYLRYNANKSLANLGLDPMFPSESAKVAPYILSALDIGGSETHDFFSGKGANYVIGKVETMDDEDWDIF